MHETGMGQQVAQLHDRYMMMTSFSLIHYEIYVEDLQDMPLYNSKNTSNIKKKQKQQHYISKDRKRAETGW
jgi:hypothetical protein